MGLWNEQFAADLDAADRHLDAYLAASAAARQVEWPPAASQGADADGESDGADWMVRAALPADQPVLRRAFEDVFARPYDVDVLVIHSRSRPIVQGVIAMQLLGEGGQAIDLRLSVGAALGAPTDEEIERVCTTRLLRAAVGRAAAGGARKVTCTIPDDADQRPLQRRLEGLGFGLVSDQTIYTMDMETLRDRCLRIVERYSRRGAIGEDVRFVSLAEGAYPRVDEFLRQFFPDGAGASPKELSASICGALFQGDTVIAGSAGHRKGPDTFVCTRLGVSEGSRGLWVSPWILGEGCRRAYEAGCRTIEFFIDEPKYPEFVKIAHGMKAERIGAICVLELELALPWGEGSQRD